MMLRPLEIDNRRTVTELERSRIQHGVSVTRTVLDTLMLS